MSIVAIYGQAIFGRSNYGQKAGKLPPDWRNALFSLKARGKADFGPPEIRGIYRVVPTKKGRIVQKLPIYKPTNPRTDKQQANRERIKNAVIAWQALSEEEKNVWRAKKKPHHHSGYIKFIKNYLDNL